MPFNIDTFKTNGLALGGARPSLFSVELTFPGSVTNAQLLQRQSTFLVRAAQLPASSVDSFDVPYFGRKIKLAGDRTFDDWTVTIMNDEDFGLKNGFEEWLNAINSHQSNRRDFGTASPQAYKVDATVSQYGKTGPSDDAGIIRQYKFVGLFPKDLAAITLDWDTTNSVETFDVTFAYDYWVPTIGNDLYQTQLSPA